jgi:hypothetical protein
VTNGTGNVPAPVPARTPPKPPFVAIQQRVNAGEPGALDELHRYLDRDPMQLAAADPAALYEERLVARMAVSPAMRGQFSRVLDDIRRKLEGPNPGAIERLLARRAAACWMALYWDELTYLEALGTLSVRQSEHRQRLIGHTHKQLLSSLKALAQIRRVSVSGLRVSVTASATAAVVAST